jgi:hypothetical protein
MVTEDEMAAGSAIQNESVFLEKSDDLARFDTGSFAIP